jgi:hypothetical protein
MLAQIAKLIVAQVLKLQGFQAWVAQMALRFGGQALLDFVSKLFKDKKRDAEQEKERKELEDIAKNPEKTPEEIAKEYADAINAGRK